MATSYLTNMWRRDDFGVRLEHFSLMQQYVDANNKNAEPFGKKSCLRTKEALNNVMTLVSEGTGHTLKSGRSPTTKDDTHHTHQCDDISTGHLTPDKNPSFLYILL